MKILHCGMLWDKIAWWGLALFVAVHACVIFTRESAPQFFEDYCDAAVLATHVFAVPAVARASKSGLRGQIVSATVVSFLYHFFRLYTSVDYAGWQRLDHAVATGLIVTVFLEYMAHVHSTGIIVLLTALAASFSFGSVLSSAVTAAVLVGLIALPYLDTITQKCLRVVLYSVSLGGEVPQALFKCYTPSQRWRLLIAFVLQLLSVASFLVGDYVNGIDSYAHALWHAFAYSSLFVLVSVLAEPEHVPERETRRVYFQII